MFCSQTKAPRIDRRITKKTNKKESSFKFVSYPSFLARIVFGNYTSSWPKRLNFSGIDMPELNKSTTSFAVSFDFKILCIY